MALTKGFFEITNDPNFMKVEQALELCADIRDNCELCPMNIRLRCIRYWDTQCTGCSNGYAMKENSVKTHIKRLRSRGALV